MGKLRDALYLAGLAVALAWSPAASAQESTAGLQMATRTPPAVRLPAPKVRAPSNSRKLAEQAALAANLATMERKLEQKRRELGVPGFALVIVKGGETIYSKGFGYRDLEKKLPVTSDTLFPVGSAAKAFTGMLAAIAVDEGRIPLHLFRFSSGRRGGGAFRMDPRGR